MGISNKCIKFMSLTTYVTQRNKQTPSILLLGNAHSECKVQQSRLQGTFYSYILWSSSQIRVLNFLNFNDLFFHRAFRHSRGIQVP